MLYKKPSPNFPKVYDMLMQDVLLTNGEISAATGMSISFVRTHLQGIREDWKQPLPPASLRKLKVHEYRLFMDIQNATTPQEKAKATFRHKNALTPYERSWVAYTEDPSLIHEHLAAWEAQGKKPVYRRYRK